MNAYSKKYYYMEEQYKQLPDGTWVGRVYRIDNVTDKYYYDYTYQSDAGALPELYTSVKRSLVDDSIILQGNEPLRSDEPVFQQNDDATQIIGVNSQMAGQNTNVGVTTSPQMAGDSRLTPVTK